MKEAKEKTIVDKAIGILQFIPKDKFTTQSFGKHTEAYCAEGWLNYRTTGQESLNGIPNCHLNLVPQLAELAGEFMGGVKDYDIIVAVNDGDDILLKKAPKYYGIDNPKDRVMTLLRDMKKAGY